MALVKWELNKKMSEQISGQNANITEIEKKINNTTLSNYNLANGDWVELIKQNWSSLPWGTWNYILRAGQSGAGAVIFKSSQNYGTALVMQAGVDTIQIRKSQDVWMRKNFNLGE